VDNNTETIALSVFLFSYVYLTFLKSIKLILLIFTAKCLLHLIKNIHLEYRYSTLFFGFCQQIARRFIHEKQLKIMTFLVKNSDNMSIQPSFTKMQRRHRISGSASNLKQIIQLQITE